MNASQPTSPAQSGPGDGPTDNSRRRACGLALIAAGLVALIGGWLRVRDASILADQISFLASSGVGGIALIMSGLGLVASANSRDEAAGRLQRIESAIRRDGGDAAR